MFSVYFHGVGSVLGCSLPLPYGTLLPEWSSKEREKKRKEIQWGDDDDDDGAKHLMWVHSVTKQQSKTQQNQKTL